MMLRIRFLLETMIQAVHGKQLYISRINKYTLKTRRKCSCSVAYAINASFSERRSDGIQAVSQPGGILFIAVPIARKG